MGAFDSRVNSHIAGKATYEKRLAYKHTQRQDPEDVKTQSIVVSKPRKMASDETTLRTPDFRFLASRTLENKYILFKPPSLLFCYSSPGEGLQYLILEKERLENYFLVSNLSV